MRTHHPLRSPTILLHLPLALIFAAVPSLLWWLAPAADESLDRTEIALATLRGGVTAVAIEALDQRASPRPPGRDIFTLADPFEERGESEIEARPVDDVARPIETEKATAIDEGPVLTMDLLGIFGPTDRRIAVFKDRAGAITNVREEDVIDGRLLVREIGDQAVEIAELGPAPRPPLRLRIDG